MEKIRLDQELSLAPVTIGMMNLLEWGLDPKELSGRLHEYLGLGLTTYDFADIYGKGGCEALFGEILEQEPSLRNKIEIVTKGGIVYDTLRRPYFVSESYNLSKEHLVSACEASLKRLKTDHVDLYLIHRPCPLMDPAEVAEAMDKLYRDGKVRKFGVSNFLPEQMAALEAYTGIPLLVNQVQMSVKCMDFLADGTQEDALRRKIPLMAYSPVGGGALHRADVSRDDLETIGVLKEIQEEIGAGNIDEVMYAWLYRLPVTVIPVTGSGKKERVLYAVNALKYSMTREQWYDILRVARPEHVSRKYHDI